MGATPFVIALVALVIPIMMMVLAIVFDAVIVGWALIHGANNRINGLRQELAVARLSVKLSTH